jgi:hypothetical protein
MLSCPRGVLQERATAVGGSWTDSPMVWWVCGASAVYGGSEEEDRAAIEIVAYVRVIVSLRCANIVTRQ